MYHWIREFDEQKKYLDENSAIIRDRMAPCSVRRATARRGGAGGGSGRREGGGETEGNNPI